MKQPLICSSHPKHLARLEDLTLETELHHFSSLPIYYA